MNADDPALAGGSVEVDWFSAYQYLEQQQEAIIRQLAARLEVLESDSKARAASKIKEVTLEHSGPGTLETTIVAQGRNLEYAFYVYRDGEQERRVAYRRANTSIIRTNGGSKYRVRGFIREHGEAEFTDTAVSAEIQL